MEKAVRSGGSQIESLHLLVPKKGTGLSDLQVPRQFCHAAILMEVATLNITF